MTFSGIRYLANKNMQIQFTTSVSIIMREFEVMHWHFSTLKGIEIISSLTGSWYKATKEIFSEKKNDENGELWNSYERKLEQDLESLLHLLLSNIS